MFEISILVKKCKKKILRKMRVRATVVKCFSALIEKMQTEKFFKLFRVRFEKQVSGKREKLTFGISI